MRALWRNPASRAYVKSLNEQIEAELVRFVTASMKYQKLLELSKSVGVKP